MHRDTAPALSNAGRWFGWISLSLPWGEVLIVAVIVAGFAMA